MNEKKYLTLGQLKYEGLIDVDIKDPNTKINFSDNLVVSIHNVGSSYKNYNKKAKLEGDYLYTVEAENNNKSLLPKIILEGLTQNSDGNYIMLLDLGEEFEMTNYTATSYDDVDLTDKVNKYIVINNQAVEIIDTTKSGIYKIYYSVVDDNGYASVSVLSVIIADSISPTITLAQETKISKDDTNFDLLYGVICEDNSGYCDITYSGEIDYGVTGKYIIEYTAQDPSGNTSTKKRVITIE